jgi:hypothetical protein
MVAPMQRNGCNTCNRKKFRLFSMSPNPIPSSYITRY